MRMYVQIFGAREAELRFTRMGEAAVNAQPGMLMVAEEIRQIIATTFRSQGRRGGGSWKRDSREWLARKVTLETYGGDPRIGFFTGELYKSYTQPDARGNILDIGPGHVNVGSDLPWAEAFNEDRPIRLTATDRTRLTKILRDYLIASWKRGASLDNLPPLSP